MPVVEQEHQHLQLLKPRNLGLALLGVSVLGAGLVAAVGLGLIGTKKPVPSPTPKTPTPQYLGYIKAPTAEQVRAVKNMVRAEGKITSIAATSLTFIPTGQTKSVTVKLTATTLYSVGQQGKTTDQASLHSGQLAIIGYDTVTTTAASVWGGYNE